MSIKSIEVPRKVVGYFRVDDLSSAVKVPGHGSVVLLQAEDDDLRYRLDGQDPTTTVGFLLPQNTSHLISILPEDVKNIRVIETTSGGILNVHWFR